MTKNRKKLIAAEGIAANLLLGTLFVWSVMRNPLLDLFPSWTEGMLSLVFGIHNLFTCLGILTGGWLRRRLSGRRVFSLFTVLVTIGLGGFAFLPVDHPRLAFGMLFVLFCCFAATGIGVGISAVQSTTIPWFPERSGAISGALYMALGFSSVILAFIAQKLLPVIGVRYVMPVFAGIVLLVSLLILSDRRSMLPPAESGENTAAADGLSPSHMLKSPAFWVLVFWNVSLRTAGLTLLDHAASIAVAFGGFTLTAMLISPANGMGSICVGAAVDKLGIHRIMRIEALLMITAGALLCFGVAGGTYGLILVGLLLGGFAYGGSSSSYAAAIKNRFGPKYYALNFSISSLDIGIAALLESGSGTLLDVTGGYLAVMLMVLALAVSALLLSLFSKKAKI